MPEPLLAIDSLAVEFSTGGRRVTAVRDVSLAVHADEIVGLAGESGSGKSTLARAAMGLVPVTRGRILLDGRDVTHLEDAARRPAWRRMQMIFQDPNGSLNPRLTVAESLAEPLHAPPRAPETRRRIARLLAEVGLPPEALDRRPRQFSGGQRQRIAIARARAVEPDLLLADEPVAALDVSVQAQIVELFRATRRARRLAMLVIAHDLALLHHLADRLVVMYAGRVVETGPARAVIAAPRHPYTALLRVSSGPGAPETLRAALPGEPPSPGAEIRGCALADRCPLARAACRDSAPALREWAPGHLTACHFPDQLYAGKAP